MVQWRICSNHFPGTEKAKKMENTFEKPTLLIVDDEKNFTESLQLALEHEFAVSIAGSLKSAREFLAKFSPAVILLDLRLPDGSGMELLRELKTFGILPVVMVMTAYVTTDNFIQALNEGAIDYFAKPMELEKLKRELRKYSASIENRLPPG